MQNIASGEFTPGKGFDIVRQLDGLNISIYAELPDIRINCRIINTVR